MKIEYILHADFEGPGAIALWAKQRGLEQTRYRPFAGEALPARPVADLLVVMGGPQSPLTMDETPYLKQEIAYIQKALQRHQPIVGVCLGAQLIGEALAAPAERSPHREVGLFPITLTPEGLTDHFLKGVPSQVAVMHWHNDMPGLTAEAQILAYSAGCPRQIVRYLPHVYGLQCHLEPTRSDVTAMIDHCPEDLAPGPFVQSKEMLLDHDYSAMNRLLSHMLDNLMSSRLPAKKSAV